MNPDEEQLLRDAIARNAGAVVSLPSAGMLRHHKARLIAADDAGFWVEAPAGERALIEELIRSEQPVGLAIKSGDARVVMATPARRFEPAMQINRETAVPALMLAWPAQVKAVQRRADYRVTVRQGSDLSARVWRITQQHYLKEKPSATAEVKASLRDLSVGGMSVVCGAPGDGPKLAADQRLRVALTHAGGELVVEGRVKHVVPLPTGEARVGVQFKNLEAGIEGRQTLAALTQIVGMLQREEVRRHRLSAKRSA